MFLLKNPHHTPRRKTLSAAMSTFSPSAHHRPKKKTYHRVPDLDKAMALHKKPSLLLHLHSLITSQPSRSLLLRDLEKHAGFIHKWNFISIIEKHPSLFTISRRGGGPFSLRLSDKALRISASEPLARRLMEPILLRNITKLLMLSIDCRLPFDKIELIRSDLGLPENFRELFILKYPEIFSLKIVGGKEYVNLERWDSTLAVTAREEGLDGSSGGPYSFKMRYAPGFRPNVSYVKEVEKWQQMRFPSPYLSARRIDPLTPQARKRAVAVLHEVLSLTMEKRLSSYKLDAFHNEYQLPCRLLLCLVKNHGIFYITNKGERSTVILKEGYDGCHLAVKCPLLQFRDKFVSLIGRPCTNFDNQIAV